MWTLLPLWRPPQGRHHGDASCCRRGAAAGGMPPQGQCRHATAGSVPVLTCCSRMNAIVNTLRCHSPVDTVHYRHCCSAVSILRAHTSCLCLCLLLDAKSINVFRRKIAGVLRARKHLQLLVLVLVIDCTCNWQVLSRIAEVRRAGSLNIIAARCAWSELLGNAHLYMVHGAH